jgi:hypothetical protein
MRRAVFAELDAGEHHPHGNERSEPSAYLTASRWLPVLSVATLASFAEYDVLGSLRAYRQSLTQLVFLTVEGKPVNIVKSPCSAQAHGGKVVSMKDQMELRFAQRVSGAQYC